VDRRQPFLRGLCTGRRFRSTLPIARELGLQGPVVAHNGALVKDAWSVPQELPFHDDTLVPFRAGGTVSWRIL